MKTLWIHAGLDGRSTVRPLPLPYKHLDRPIDPEIFRRQARGEDVGKAKMFESAGMRTMRLVGERLSEWEPASQRNLCFVLGGSLAIETGDGTINVLSAGDVFLEDDGTGQGHRIRYQGDCRMAKLLVAEGWVPGGIVPPLHDNPEDAQPRPGNIKRMYRGDDDKSYFRDFDELFPDTEGSVSELRPVIGYYFVSFPAGFFIDWHPEGANNFVVVTAGELELEVCGDGRIEVFGPGGVVLAEDRTGKGHIDRMRGFNRLAMIVFDDKDLWEVPAKPRALNCP